MDSFSRVSSVYLVPDEKIISLIVALEATWSNHFLPPVAIQGDQAFAKEEFLNYLKLNGISFIPVLPRRHHKSTLESKHGTIRSIFLRLRHASPNDSTVVLDPSQTTCMALIYSRHLRFPKHFPNS